MSFKPRSVAIKKKPAVAVAAPAASTSAAASSAASSNDAPAALVPRAIAKRTKPAGPSNTTTNTTVKDDEPVASTSKALAAVKLDPREEQRLENLLATVESCFCDWGLSVHQESGLLQRLKTSKDGYVHLQHVLQLQPVRAITDSQADVQRALKLRPSSLLTVHESGFQLRRTTTPDFAHLEQLHPADWDDMALYLENIPSIPSSSSLSTFLSALLSTQLQRLILPPLFDPSNPPPEITNPESDYDQSAAFAQSQAAANGKAVRRKGKGLPSGGGPFRGYAFVVVESKEDAERITKEWEWESSGAEHEKEGQEDEMEQDEPSKTADDPALLARKSRFRALSYAKWLDLKTEYLKYQAHLRSLRDSHDRSRKSASYRERQRRSPSPPRPSRADHRQNQERDEPSGFARNGKRVGEGDAQDRPPKKVKRGSSPSRPHPHARLGTPEPLDPSIAPDSEEALSARGAFPKGCILWVRNVHEKSTKTSLKGVMGRLLEDWEEGSGKGVEFVDYEKSLDVCHLRFSSSHLAELMVKHFNESTCVHLAPNYISTPDGTSTPPSDIEEDPTRRPIKAELLEGERERIYWQGLPESTRRGARKSAGGPVALVKEKKRQHDDGEAELARATGSDDERKWQAREEEERKRVQEEESRPRKKPTIKKF